MKGEYTIVFGDGETFSEDEYHRLDDAIGAAETYVEDTGDTKVFVVSRSDFICWTATTGRTGLV